MCVFDLVMYSSLILKTVVVQAYVLIIYAGSDLPGGLTPSSLIDPLSSFAWLTYGGGSLTLPQLLLLLPVAYYYYMI